MPELLYYNNEDIPTTLFLQNLKKNAVTFISHYMNLLIFEIIIILSRAQRGALYNIRCFSDRLKVYNSNSFSASSISFSTSHFLEFNLRISSQILTLLHQVLLFLLPFRQIDKSYLW